MTKFDIINLNQKFLIKTTQKARIEMSQEMRHPNKICGIIKNF